MAKFRFSEKEQAVLELAISGLNDREVAERIGVGVETVRTYWKRIRQKLDVDSRSQAIATVVRHSVDSAIEDQASLYDELKRELELRQKSEALLHAVFDSVIDPIIVANGDGFCLDLNPAACEVLGRRKDMVVGRHSIDFIPASHHDEFRRAWDIIRRSRWWRGDLPVLRADGRIVMATWGSSANLEMNFVVGVLRTIKHVG